jgi:hypothetical protein
MWAFGGIMSYCNEMARIKIFWLLYVEKHEYYIPYKLPWKYTWRWGVRDKTKYRDKSGNPIDKNVWHLLEERYSMIYMNKVDPYGKRQRGIVYATACGTFLYDERIRISHDKPFNRKGCSSLGTTPKGVCRNCYKKWFRDNGIRKIIDDQRGGTKVRKARRERRKALDNDET